MRLRITLALLFFATNVLAADVVSQEQAVIIAEAALRDRAVQLDQFEPPVVSEHGNKWALHYRCKEPADCEFFATVRRSGGAVAMSAALDAPLEDAPEAIQEVILAQEIARRGHNVVVCIELSGARPSGGLLQRLSESGTTVVDASECVGVTNVDKGSYHAPTGRPAIFFKVGQQTRIDDDHITVGFQSYRNGLDAEGVTMFLERHNGKWVVAKRQSNWIS